MADPRLQWRQLSQAQPNVSGLMRGANDALNNAASAAESILGRYEAGKTKKNDIEVANELAALDTQEEIDSYFANGGLNGRQVSDNIIQAALGRQGSVMDYADTRSGIQNRDSIMQDRAGRLAIANDVNSRAGQLHGVAMEDHEWRQGRRSEMAGLKGEVIAARLAGEERGSNRSSNADPSNYITYSNQNATRNKPINDKLAADMSFLGDMGVRMDVISGGQDGKGEGTRRTGSTRHDHGNAADVDFYIGDRKLDWNNKQDLPILEEIVGRAKANGITGIGAGDDYMGAGRFHIGYGPEATWGAKGSSDNTPEFLSRAVANASKYTDSSGNVNVQQASAGVKSGEADPRDILAASVANSQYLSLEDVDSIMNGSQSATDRGDKRIAEELSEQVADLTAQLTMDAVANPDNLTSQDVMGEVAERAAAAGMDSSEVLDIQKAAEAIVGDSEGLAGQLAPTVAADIERDLMVENTISDERRRFEGRDQNRALNDISRYQEDPTGNLISDLGVGSDGEDPGGLGGMLGMESGFDANKLRNLVNEYANKFNVEPSVVAVAMRDSFNRDPWGRNDLRSRFNEEEVKAAVDQLGPDQRRQFDRERSDIEIMETQMAQVQQQQNRLRQQLAKLPQGDPRRRSLEAQIIALDGQLDAIYSNRRTGR